MKYSRVDVIRSHIKAVMDGVYTMLPAIVRSYDSTTQTVDVQLSVSQTVGSEDYVEAPLIKKVPVMFPFGDTFRMGWNLKEGDNVMMIYAMRSLTEYKASDGKTPTVPTSQRRHSKMDGVALAGMLPSVTRDEVYKDNPHLADKETYIVFNKDDDDGIFIESDKDIHLKTANNIVIESAKEVNITSTSNTNITAPVTNINGDLNVTGKADVAGIITSPTDVLGGGKSLKTHVHAHGTPNTSPPI